ncbi:thioesterase II family protein [Catenulispora subtropica]|uniref:Alpha/beta fold hydrolase n=1 Tax=Catenulispora subtropica TaxID=450798 RepID=A0ABN2SB56_9ACTN
MGSPSSAAPLLVPQSSPSGATAVDFVAFPAAGTGASGFRDWRETLPADWRFTVVNLPGREAGYGEPFATDMAALADDVAAELRAARAAAPDAPLVLFGHSMGGLLAFLVAHRLPVDGLVVAACAPPGIRRFELGAEPPSDEALRGDVAEALAAAGVSALFDEAGEGLLDEMVDLAVPVLRADIELLTTFRAPGTPLNCRVLALYGKDDPLAPAPWTSETTAPADRSFLDGGHFFVQLCPADVVAELQRWLAPVPEGVR